MADPDAPNSLPTNEMEIPIIVDVPKEPSVQTDPGLRQSICTFSVNEQDRIRKEYIQLGPCQPKLENYPSTFDGRDNRRFQYRWFSLFPWLEYSVATDKVFCFPCFLFKKYPSKSPLFTTKGCCNWSRMLAGKKGFCEQHVGQSLFCLLLTNKIMGITDLLSQALQRQSQDIVNAMNLVSSTKTLLQELRDHGWDSFFLSVHQFGEDHGLEMPKMDAAYSMGTGRGCQQHDFVTNEHHYHFGMFNVIIDVQMMELNDRFTEQSIELLVLSSTLDPKNQFKKFDIDKICELAEKFYPEDFDTSEVQVSRLQLEHYRCQVVSNKDFQELSSLAQLCRRLVETDLAKLFPLVDILIRLVLTLPVSTATTERAFSAMKIIKTRLRNKMEDGYLSGCMMLHIEKEYVDDIDSEVVIDHFESTGDRRAQFR